MTCSALRKFWTTGDELALSLQKKKKKCNYVHTPFSFFQSLHLFCCYFGGSPTWQSVLSKIEIRLIKKMIYVLLFLPWCFPETLSALTSNAEFRRTCDTDRQSLSNAVKAHLPHWAVVSLGSVTHRHRRAARTQSPGRAQISRESSVI